MARMIRAFADNDAATTPIEYAIIGAIIALAIVGIVANIGTQLSSMFSEVSSAIK